MTLIGLSATPLAIIGMIVAPHFLVGCFFYLLWAMCFSGVVQNGISFRQRITPDGLLSRVNTTARVIAWDDTPFGAALGGVLAEMLGVREAYLIMVVKVALSAVIGWFSPLRYRQAI